MAKSLEEKKRDARIQKQVENLGGKAKPPEPKTLKNALKRAKLKAEMTQSASNFMEKYGFEKPTVEDRTLALMKGRRGVYNKNVPKELRDREKYEMKDGGDVPMPKRRPKKDQFRADKTESLDKEFSKKVAKQNEKNMKNVKKMKDGGLTGNQFKLDKNKNGRIDGGDFAKMEVGGEALVTPIMKGKRISEKRKKLLLRREKEEMKKDIPVKKMEMGGKVEEYGGGGKVKGGKMTCRGMGAAVKGGGFSIS